MRLVLMKKVYEDMCDGNGFQATVFCAGVRCKAICSMTRAALLQYLGSLGRARARDPSQVSTQRALTALAAGRFGFPAIAIFEDPNLPRLRDLDSGSKYSR